jgi:hypothetical protein
MRIEFDMYGPVECRLVASKFIELFRASNDRFDEQRFLVACGLVDAPAKRIKGVQDLG